MLRALVSRLPLVIVGAVTVALFVRPYLQRDDPASGQAQPPAIEEAMPVTTVVARRSDLEQTYRATGVVAAAFEAKIAAQIDGVMREVLVSVGDRVAQDQPLASLDDRVLRAELEQAEAALARSTDERERVALLAERRLTDARREQSAIAQHRIDRAAVGKLQTLLSLTRFPSPVAGIVTARLVQPGDHMQAGAHLFTIADVSRLRVFAKVPEQVALGVDRGEVARVEVEGVAGTSRRARVDRVYPSSDPVSHQTIVELDLGAVYPSLRPGLQTTVVLPIERRSGVVVVDRTAIPEVPADGVVDAFVVEGGRARARRLRLGLVLEQQVEITSGLAEGEAVVVRRGGRVQDGTAVRDARGAPLPGGGS